MFVQALSLWFTLLVNTYSLWIICAALLGIGTAMVNPTILASISDVAHPEWRATFMGVYRFWKRQWIRLWYINCRRYCRHH
ncbi:hypothetical protein [Halobacillus karajensis]|uniref:hypothetical protein n=1 Tax=Halobacillus karajensis TaxID=195088 RepID=UPI00292A45B8|nr:hypothetical protein [Halobacillus karajensis]